MDRGAVSTERTTTMQFANVFYYRIYIPLVGWVTFSTTRPLPSSGAYLGLR